LCSSHTLAVLDCVWWTVLLVGQVGLIVFLAHIGSFVPADSCRIGVVDRIFTRITSVESVTNTVPQSAFMCELNQLALMLRHATPRSLLLIDEFGKVNCNSYSYTCLSGLIGPPQSGVPQFWTPLWGTYTTRAYKANGI